MTFKHAIAPYVHTTSKILSTTQMKQLATSATVAVLLWIPSANSLTLQDAMARTLTHHPQLHQYSFRQQALEGELATASLKPALELGIELENIGRNSDDLGLGSAENTLSLSSTLELSGQRQARITATKTRTAQLQLERKLLTLSLLGDLTRRYIQSLATQEALLLSQQSLQLAQAMENTVTERTLRGGAPPAEALRAQAATTQAAIRLRDLRHQYQREKLALSLFWGQTEPDFARLDGHLMSFAQADNFDLLWQRVQQSPAMNSLASATRLQAAQLQLAQSQSRTTINWQLGLRRYEDTGDTGFIAGISVPLNTTGRSQGAIRTARAAHELAQARQDSGKTQLYQQLFNAYSIRETHIKTLNDLNNSLIPALEQALQLTRKGYESGRDRYQDWANAQQELIQAKHQRIETAAAIQSQQAIIEQLSGQQINRSQENKAP